MKIEKIYQPIASRLKMAENLIASSLKRPENRCLVEIGEYVLAGGGKRIRPAIVLLCERAVSVSENHKTKSDKAIKLAAAVELIHQASLIHDDIVDNALIRHNKPTVNARWPDISIVYADYIYSVAFELISQTQKPGIFSCISKAAAQMSEGELNGLFQRGNLDLSQESYTAIIKKKTAGLFAVCCQAAALLCNCEEKIQTSLRKFGLNFGMAFQIADDGRDITGKTSRLGKDPGRDIVTGQMTLPLINLLKATGQSKKKRLISILKSGQNIDNLKQLKQMYLSSIACDKTQDTIASYVHFAKQALEELGDSEYKQSLLVLADYIAG